MKVRIKITGFLGLTIFIVSIIMLIFILLGAGRIRESGKTITTEITDNAEANIKQELLDLSKNIGNYALALEAEIDRNMLNAANVLYEADRLTGGRLTVEDLKRLKQQTGMSDFYLCDMNGIFTLSTEPAAAGLSIFNIWEGYMMLVTGESDYLPSNLKIKVETGEIFKTTAIPRANNRGILESALDAGVIEEYLQNFINTNSKIRSMNLFDFTFLTLTENRRSGTRPVYTKGGYVPSGKTEISDLFKDSSKINISFNRENAQVYYPVIDGGEVRYVLFIDLDISGYFAAGDLVKTAISGLARKISSLNALFFIFVFFVLIASTGIIYIFTDKFLAPFGFFDAMLASFSRGDFSVTVPEKFINRNDETGEISASFMNVVDNIKSLISNIKNGTSSLSDIITDLSDKMEKISVSINQITKNIHNIKKNIQNQNAGVTQNHLTIEQVNMHIQKLSEQIENQSSDILQASSAVGQMVTNIRSVTETLINNSSNVNTLSKASEIGRAGLQEVAENIQEIAQESEGLMQINSVMQNIASKTNLLAMNAAIEATHAGESDIGFMVVAGEIRKLAENSGKQSKIIGSVLKKIKGSIDNIIKSTENVMDKFKAIDKNIRIVTDQEENVRNSMEKQETGSKQILEGIGSLNEITRRIKNDSRGMLNNTKGAIFESEKLKMSAQNITYGINETANSADEINAAINHVNQISAKNREAIAALINEVARFKIE